MKEIIDLNEFRKILIKLENTIFMECTHTYFRHSNTRIG